MTPRRKRCEFCHGWYRPHPRTWRIQRACFEKACRRQRRTQANRRWRVSNPGYDKGRRVKKQAWAKAHPAYWRRYRRTHPEYRGRDNRRRVRAWRQALTSANQDAIREISLQKLRGIREMTAQSSANQDAILRAAGGIVEYLFWKEGSANQDEMVLGPASG